MSDEFFSPPPRGQYVKPGPRPEWMGPPRGMVPAVLPIEQVVARSDDAAIYLSCLWVYKAGFEYEVFVVARDEESELDPFGYEHDLRSERTGEIPPAKVRFGFRFGDGSKVTNTGGEFDWEWEPGPTPKAPRMSGGRGHGGEGAWAHAFWVWPLPPRGSIEFVCEWPAAGIPLTTAELDAAAIIDAASRAQAIF